jgi:acetyl esterase/lipase
MLNTSMAFGSDKPVINVWPATAPGETGAIGPEQDVNAKAGQRKIRRITNVTQPTLTIYKAPSDKDTGAAVLIAPGGGYHILAFNYEGTEVAEWLNSIGVTGIVLKYRVPRRPGEGEDVYPLGAKQDAQRAMSLMRSRASELGIDPKRLGMLGFSAGGHLTAWTSNNSDKRAYERIDSIDDASSRPDFSILLYPAYLTPKDHPDQLSPEMRVTKDTPPCFLAHAADDHILPANSIRYFEALNQNKVSAELHIFSSGGHGFGLGEEGKPTASWPKLCEAWMRSSGLLERKR